MQEFCLQGSLLLFPGACRFRPLKTAKKALGSPAARLLSTWLFGIAANLYRMFQRHARVETSARARLGMQLSYERAVESDLADERLSAERAWVAISLTLTHLSEDQRMAIKLRVFDSHSYAEIANEMRTTEATARARVMRALRTLRLQARNTGES